MDVFKANPRVFPVKISGCGSFKDGETCKLNNALQLPAPVDGWFGSTGKVAVSTTPTSVKFTVVGDGYLDSAESTITFSWNPGAGDRDGHNLDATTTVTFPNSGMYNAFRKAEQAANGPWVFAKTGTTATLSC